MTAPPPLPRAARLYLCAVALAAGVAMAVWVWAWNSRYAGALDGVPPGGPAPGGPPAFGELEPPLALALLAGLLATAVLAQLHSLQLGPRRKVNVAIGVYFAGLLLSGPAVGMALAGAGQLLGQGAGLLRRDPGTGRRRTTARAALFNTGQMMLATAAGGAVYAAAVPLRAPDPLQRLENLWALPLTAGAMYAVNSLAVAVMVALQLGQTPAAMWRSGRRFDLLHFAAPFLAGLAVALAASRQLWGTVLLVALLAVIHLILRQTLRLDAGARAARAAAAREASAASRARSEFFRVAAHEVRTPLTSLRGYVQLLQLHLDPGTTHEPERTRRALRVIDEESERLVRLASQLNDASRLHQGRLELERRPAELAACVRRVVEAVGQTGRHPLHLNAPENVWAIVDAPRLELAVRSLLDLLLRYGAAGEPVEVAVSRASDDAAVVALWQPRAVLPPEYRQHLAERYARSVGEHRLGDLGLGLYVGRLVVEAHGGAIRAECPPEGGARFVITLPVQDAPLPAVAAGAHPAGDGERAADPPPTTPRPAA
jgi:signal transduction histidine kinase